MDCVIRKCFSYKHNVESFPHREYRAHLVRLKFGGVLNPISHLSLLMFLRNTNIHHQHRYV